MESLNVMATEQTSKPIYIFIDGSYYCFHRYYSLLNWWKNAHPDENNDVPMQNTLFVEKFKKTFIETIEQIPKKLKLINKKQKKLTNPIKILVGRDCKRENIWRNQLFDKYKATRLNSIESGFMGGPFFKMAYEEDLFQKAGAEKILYHPHLEADDCIAIYVKKILQEQPDCTIYIITSDNDYLQLIRENVHIYNLAFKNLKESKTFTGDPRHDLQLKIIMGDTSDNIPSVFPKCGIKTAKKCIEDKEFFEKKMASNEEYYKQYNLNENLVSFDKIPNNLKEEFLQLLD